MRMTRLPFVAGALCSLFFGIYATAQDKMADRSIFSGRTKTNRVGLIEKFGGSKESEQAVELALAWIVKHQLPDGGWSFDHRDVPGCNCMNHGRLEIARNAATGLAILALLGSGRTHEEGEYTEAVFKGVRFLRKNVNRKTGTVSGRNEKRMYAHGIATAALCEAAAITDDKTLLPFASLLTKFIVDAQDPVGGGWRYLPRQPGDTSVLGWQVMALKAAKAASVEFPENTLKGARHFLDSVQKDGGSKYGYKDPGSSVGTTAIGLLCRMHLGWPRDHKPLAAGINFIRA